MKRSPTARRLLAAIEAAVSLPDVQRTRPALAAASHCAPIYAGSLLKQLHEAGRIHIAGWAHHAITGPLTPVWSPGAGEDVAYPAEPPKPGWRGRPTGKRLLAWIEAGNRGTVRQIAMALAMSVVTADQIIRAMHVEGVVRIRRWERCGGGGIAAVFERRIAGSGRTGDAPRPGPLGVTAWRHRRLAKLQAAFGDEVARQIYQAMFHPGRSKSFTVCVAGRPVYRRGEGMLVDLDQAVREVCDA
jgi:hypothetical protein